MHNQNIQEWVGRTQTQSGRLGIEIAQMLHATLPDNGVKVPQQGDVIPPLWHWSAFAPKVPMNRISSDGHPERGDFLPPIALPRRMWASGEVNFHAPMHVGADLIQTSAIESVDQKSDDLILVHLRHEVSENGIVAVTETQTLAYLPIPRIYLPPAKRPVPPQHAFAKPVAVNNAMLFRYSAATFNAHRIHYDLSYTLKVEKYPGLVVHGPLQATLLMSAAVDHTKHSPKTFRYRGIHPMFCDDDLYLFGHDVTDNGMKLCTGVPHEHKGMQAEITWKDPS